MRFFSILLLSCIFSISAFAQNPVSTDPPFPTQVDDVTVYYDASKGNGALEGYTGTVYAHAGLITSESTAPNDWKYVQGNWGTADANVQMTSEGNDVYSIAYNLSLIHI